MSLPVQFFHFAVMDWRRAWAEPLRKYEEVVKSVPGALREGAVKYGRAPADQAPPPLPSLNEARHVIRPIGGVRGEFELIPRSG